MAHLWRSGFARRIILLRGVLRSLDWWRRSPPVVMSLRLLLSRVLMLGSRHRGALVIGRVLKLWCRLGGVWVSRVGGSSAVLRLSLPGIEILGRTIDICRRTALETWVWARRLPRRGQIIACNAVLVESFREPIFQHPVIITHSCLEFGVQVQKSICTVSVTAHP